MDLLPEERAEAIGEIGNWPRLVERAEYWERLAPTPTPTADARRHETATLVGGLAKRRRSAFYLLADDPWQDVGFPARMLDRLRWLLGHLPADVELSLDENALLVAAPFLYDTLWAGVAADCRGLAPHDLTPSPDATSDRAAFEHFALSFGQAHRRAVEAVRHERWDAAEEIGWWLLHRWTSRRPEGYRPETIADLLDDAGTSAQPGPWQPARLIELLRAMRADTGFLARTDRQQGLADVGADGVRERLVGYLLVVARALAIETPALPEVIGEHLGITDPVTAADLRAAAGGQRWHTRGPTLILSAGCQHPAIEVALRAHAEALNQLLSEVQRVATEPHPAESSPMAPLRYLPARTTAEGLGPAEVDGIRAYHSAGTRFRLAEDRVRELLMGEQLYGDPKLAIRELYQNALDACRYREARTEYLRRARDLDLPWAGQIRFEQGVDAERRPYLDCVDNGIGMGIRELTEVFSQAGVRLADLPEFIEEQADWSRLDPPVQLFPNSRFGIGVLSYFMLADEITVETCRLGRDGRPGEKFKVSIAGPGSLFRIRTIRSGTSKASAGTRIRLHLRRGGPAVDCVQVLRDLLWVADFHTEAVSESDRRTWPPGQLSDAQAPNASEGWGECSVAAAGARVWWCSGTGAVLADGLWAGEKIHGAVVNLSRDLAPRLSVDRTKILAYRQEDVDRLLWEAVGALVEAGGKVLGYDWLYALAKDRPLVADVIFDQALAAGYQNWAVGDETVDASIAGCFASDSASFSGPDELIEWRLTALAAGGRFRKIIQPDATWSQGVRSCPSDPLIMSADLDGTSPWLDSVDIVSLAHLVRAGRRVGREPAEIAARLEALGYEPAVGHDTIRYDQDDLIITSRDLDGERPWLRTATPVTTLHLLRAADKTGRPIAELAARLTLLGYQVDVDPDRLPVHRLEPDDVVITSRDLDGRHPWLAPEDEVSALHVLRAARKVSRGPTDLAARLAALGFRLAPGCAGLDASGEDIVFASRDLDLAAPWLSLDESVPPVHVLKASEKTGRSAVEVAFRMVQMGYTVPFDAATLETIEAGSDDLVMFSRDIDGKPPWILADEPVPFVHLMRTARELRRPIEEIVARLIACGYRVEIDPETILIDELQPDDLILASVDLDGTSPWLDSGETVRLAHLYRASKHTRRDVHDVAARLAVLGYGVKLKGGSVACDEFTDDDLLITSRDLDSEAPWLSYDTPVPLAHIVLAAGRTRRSMTEVVSRIEQLGFTVDSNVKTSAAESVSSDDLTAISVDLDGKKPWLDPQISVSVAHVFRAAKRTRRPMAEIAARLAGLGYQVPDAATRLPRPRPGGL